MNAQNVTLAVLACSLCGAPMHPDPAKLAFFCPFCGSTVAYSDQVVRGARPLVFKHKPVEVHDGLLKLIRVAVMEGVHDALAESNPMGPHVRWARSFNDYVATIDRRAYVTRRDRFEFEFLCVHCGAPVKGSSTQTMYACDSCGSVYGLDDLSDMGLDKLPQIVGNQSMVPSKCLPFVLPSRQAQMRVRYLVSQNPGFFAGFDVEGMLRSGQLAAVYTPASLCDVALRVNTDSSLGKVEFYLEWIDWTLPRDTGLDIGLLDRMAPWDFNEAGVFVPELVVGDVTICAATNYQSKLGIVNSLVARAASEGITERYGAERLDMILWSLDFVEHQSGLIALPVYYLEQMDGAGGGLRIMVNGQTGAVQAVVRQDGRERFWGIAGVGDGRVDGERSMRLVPVPVRYEKPSHLYRVLTPEEAFGRRLRKMGGTAAVESGAPAPKKLLFSKVFGK